MTLSDLFARKQGRFALQPIAQAKSVGQRTWDAVSAGDPSGWHCRVARTASMDGPCPTGVSGTPPACREVLLIDWHAALGASSQAVVARKPPGGMTDTLKTILMDACFAHPTGFA